MKRCTIRTALVIFAVILAACSGQRPAPTPTPITMATSTPLVVATVERALDETPTAPAAPTSTVVASPTPTPLTHASTPVPTSTPVPLVTPTPTPTPTLSGPLSLAGSITDLSSQLIHGSFESYSFQDRAEALVASLITISAPNADGNVTVIGARGAIPAITGQTMKDWLRIATINWGAETCIRFSSDGSFSTQLPAGPGTTILLASVREPSCEGQWNRGAAAAVIRVPEGVDYVAPSMPFSISGFNDTWHWFASGELLGDDPHIRFTLPDGSHEGCIVPRLYVYRLFNAQGEYAGQVNLNVHGPVMTPTGLPIETNQGPDGYWALVTPTVPGKAVRDQCLNTNARYELVNWSSGLEPGWYRPRIVFYEVGQDGSERLHDHLGGASQSPSLNGGIETNTGIGYLPMIKVGAAQTPRVPVTLLNESPSWGSGGIRGVVAREDQSRFALGSRRAAQGPFIASLWEPLSGRRLTYLLEPYLPTFAYTGFVSIPPQIPLMPLDESALGVLSASLIKPDGSVVALATEAPILQSFISGDRFNAYPVELSFSGPGRTYGVTTGLDSLEVDFDQYGLHTVSLTGTLRTLWGQELKIEGNYDLWVAEPLDLSLGTFEGTPLEVGDQWSPVVVVEPGVPAQVQMTVDHYVDGDPAKKLSFQTSGTANRFGYFVADEAWVPEDHGEYILRVTAAYTDPVDGTLWMGTRAGASIVATPDTSLVAHGERNSQLANIAGDTTLRAWFFTRTFETGCGESTCDGKEEARSVGSYPFFRGDVAWLTDRSPITPSITLEDPGGILEVIAPQVRSNTYCYSSGCVDALDTKTGSIVTTKGKGGQHRPEAIDSWAYWYSSSVRPDVSILHVASDVRAEHNQWYGNDSYNCQIGLTCFRAWDSRELGDRTGDEEGDIKLLFGGAVVKNGSQQQFVPYTSMVVIVHQAIQRADGSYELKDLKGNRICPPYQGAGGGLATCGPLLTIEGREVDLFVTPTGTRPGSVLEEGDTFVFSGQAWPTLDVAVDVTVTSPSGEVHSFSGRASTVGYIDAVRKTFTVTEPGIYTVHVTVTQDRPVPSTGLAPDPPLVADGRTTMTEYGYDAPLSAILGSFDSTYRFFVAEPRDDIQVDTAITVSTPFQRQVPTSITLTFGLPEDAKSVRYTVTIPGLIIRDEAVSGSPDQVRIELDQEELYAQGYTGVVLGADSMQITVVGEVDGEWFAKALNLRSSSPLGGAPASIR